MGLTTDEFLSALKEADGDLLKPLLRATLERFGPANVNTMLAMLGDGDTQANPFAAGLLAASEMPPANAPTPIWYGMYPGRVTFLVGESGAGKSSLLYNVAVYAAKCERLFDFNFLRACRVLYVDPENSGNYRDGERDGGLCRMKIERIGKGQPDRLVFHDGRGVDLSNITHMAALEELICRE